MEEEKICVEDCKETDYKYFIDGEFKCIANCDESKYLIEDNKCIKKEEEKDEEEEEEKDEKEEKDEEEKKDEKENISIIEDCPENSKYIKLKLLLIFIYLFF